MGNANSNTPQQQPQTGDATATKGFGTESVAMTHNPAQAALAAREQAAVNARFIMALQRPRSWDDVRVRILTECKRPGFAAVARYRKPIGKGVEGPSIRFAEACMRYAGNMDVQTSTTYDDRTKRILHIVAIDYETNSSCSADLTIDKTVERRETKDRVVIAQRTNSTGAVVYIVEATEDELLNKTNAMISKAMRTLVIRLIPGDIVDEGQAQCIETVRGEHKTDPTAARKRVIDGYARIGVMPSDLETYLGHPLAQLTQDEYVELKGIHQTITDGEATWAAVMEAKRGPKEPTKDKDEAATSQATKLTDKVKRAGAQQQQTIDVPAAPPSKPAREPGEEG